MSAIDTSLVAEVMNSLDRLPQAPQIPLERAQKWIENTFAAEAGRADLEDPLEDIVGRVIWHVNRAFGIGGSEIGVLVEHQAGISDVFTSAREICMGKLLISAPEPSEGQLLRGSYMEPLIQRAFLKSYNAEQDLEALAAFRDIPRDEQHPWQVGNPDDIVIINRRRYLVDYKCPSPDYCNVMINQGMSVGYAAQLHHYEMIGRRAGIDFDGRLLAPIDTNIMRVYGIDCPWDEELAQASLEAGDHFWNDYVLKGQLPDFLPRPEEDEFEPDDFVKAAAEEAARYKAIEHQAKEKVDQIKGRISVLAGEAGMTGKSRMKLGIATVATKSRENYDEHRMLRILEKNQIDASDFVVQTKRTYDLPRMYETIAQLDDDSFNLRDLRAVGTDFSVRFPASNHKYHEALIFADMKAEAAGLVENADLHLQQTVPVTPPPEPKPKKTAKSKNKAAAKKPKTTPPSETKSSDSPKDGSPTTPPPAAVDEKDNAQESIPNHMLF